MATDIRIRDLRESKGLSQTAAAEICGLTFSKYERIETGSPRTTEEEIRHVLAALRHTKKTGKKLVGRPFSDPAKQAAVEAARAKGESVAAVIFGQTPVQQQAQEQQQPAAKPARAPRKRAPRKKASASV